MFKMDTSVVFISHSSQDSECAVKICTFLESHGIKCWIAPRDIKPGAAYPSEITRGIKECSTFLIILTEESVHSPHVNTETDIAFNNDKQIIPFFIDEVSLGDSMSYYLARKQWILGYENHAQAMDALLHCVLGDDDVKYSEDTVEESKDIHSSNADDSLKRESPHSFDKQKNLKGYSRKQLYLLGSITVLLLLFIPILGIVVAALLWLYPMKVQAILRNHKKHTIIALSLILGLILFWCVYLWYDDYKYGKNAENHLIDKPTSSVVDDKDLTETHKDEGASPTNETVVGADDDSSNTKNPSSELVATTIVDGSVCDAKWRVEKGYDVALKGNIVFHYNNIDDFICELHLYKRTVRGKIENVDGASLGYFKGTICQHPLSYLINGEIVVFSYDYHPTKLSCSIDIEYNPAVKEIFDKEINKTND